ncbi:uncharacterized protein LOC124461202 [Drosophila willistoni]|uniref:uncharacterized protein LOC124461202 n=1 Tax=Drosophila willistoni TaxID=7260 RepID=UPI001F086441|nr:uncharacterized protein LOC124461202 [Drosophila willistoni]
MAYAAVGYWRVEDTEGWKVSFIMGKTKCAPMKLSTVPRVELQAAVMATRLRNSILEGHDIQPKRVCMWSDSSTVLAWIRSDQRKYKPYVAHRVNEILESSRVEEWNLVAGKDNPADFGTKIKRDSRQSLWVTGPDFLLDDLEESPQQSKGNFSTDMELRPKFCMVTTKQTDDLFGRFSSYTRLVRTLAWVLRFRRGEVRESCLMCSEMDYAEVVLFRSVQKSSYPDEYSELARGKLIDKGSSILKLTPEMDNDSLLRVGGRIDKACR